MQTSDSTGHTDACVRMCACWHADRKGADSVCSVLFVLHGLGLKRIGLLLQGTCAQPTLAGSMF